MWKWNSTLERWSLLPLKYSLPCEFSHFEIRPRGNAIQVKEYSRVRQSCLASIKKWKSERRNRRFSVSYLWPRISNFPPSKECAKFQICVRVLKLANCLFSSIFCKYFMFVRSALFYMLVRSVEKINFTEIFFSVFLCFNRSCAMLWEHRTLLLVFCKIFYIRGKTIWEHRTEEKWVYIHIKSHFLKDMKNSFEISGLEIFFLSLTHSLTTFLPVLCCLWWEVEWEHDRWKLSHLHTVVLWTSIHKRKENMRGYLKWLNLEKIVEWVVMLVGKRVVSCV
jgi:hypothetical protein